MHTFRRILKYMPAVAFGLLVAAWVVSQYKVLMIPLDSDGRLIVGIQGGDATTEYLPGGGGEFHFNPRRTDGVQSWRNSLGSLFAIETDFHSHYVVPIALLATALLPLAIGPFLSFRFRLWHYLAYTALVAIELAYYLRWQE